MGVGEYNKRGGEDSDDAMYTPRGSASSSSRRCDSPSSFYTGSEAEQDLPEASGTDLSAQIVNEVKRRKSQRGAASSPLAWPELDGMENPSTPQKCYVLTPVK